MTDLDIEVDGEAIANDVGALFTTNESQYWALWAIALVSGGVPMFLLEYWMRPRGFGG